MEYKMDQCIGLMSFHTDITDTRVRSAMSNCEFSTWIQQNFFLLRLYSNVLTNACDAHRQREE
jgi:hypothetical protein